MLGPPPPQTGDGIKPHCYAQTPDWQAASDLAKDAKDLSQYEPCCLVRRSVSPRDLNKTWLAHPSVRMTSTVNMAQSASSATARTSIVSAPGKVLIAGGYLVLEPTFPGLVIATTSRFYSVVRRGSRNRGSDTKISSHPQIHEAAANNTPSVRVHSPQFEGATWEYLVKIDGSHSTLTQTRATYENALSGRNPFVGLAVLYAIRLALEARAGDDVLESLGQSGLDVWVLADNDFYSQRSAVSRQ